MNDLKDKWEKGKATSLSFYRQKLRWKVVQFNHKFSLPMYFVPLIGDKKKVSIVDVGAGMFSTIGCLWHGAEVKITSCDILADEYKKILDTYKVNRLWPIEKQDMEHMTYQDESFDIVHCANALDHCADPHAAIREMCRICKKDGWVYFRHYKDVGELRRYIGLHQWNICPFGDEDCMFWHNEDNFLLSDTGYNFRTVMRKDIGNEPEMVVSTFHKE